VKPFEGIFPVMLTPYANGGIDDAGIRHLIDYLIDADVHGLVVLGSNGENPYLTDGEKRHVIDVALDQAGGRVPVIVGTGCMGTEATVALTLYARAAGADAALVAMPQYFAVDFDRVKAHYSRIAREGGLPVVYYNFPATTHLHLTPKEIAEIGSIQSVVGAKETILDVDEIAALAELTDRGSFSVLSGTSLNLATLVGRGVVGAICALANLAPRQCVALFEALRKRDAAEAAAHGEFIQKLVPLAVRPAGQALLKEALRQLGHPLDPAVKGPLPPLSAGDRELVTGVLQGAGLPARPTG
jgi:4-hydroxy-tetrahydrodipicolinate synthase